MSEQLTSEIFARAHPELKLTEKRPELKVGAVSPVMLTQIQRKNERISSLLRSISAEYADMTALVQEAKGWEAQKATAAAIVQALDHAMGIDSVLKQINLILKHSPQGRVESKAASSRLSPAERALCAAAIQEADAASGSFVSAKPVQAKPEEKKERAEAWTLCKSCDLPIAVSADVAGLDNFVCETCTSMVNSQHTKGRPADPRTVELIKHTTIVQEEGHPNITDVAKRIHETATNVDKAAEILVAVSSSVTGKVWSIHGCAGWVKLLAASEELTEAGRKTRNALRSIKGWCNDMALSGYGYALAASNHKDLPFYDEESGRVSLGAGSGSAAEAAIPTVGTPEPWPSPLAPIPVLRRPPYPVDELETRKSPDPGPSPLAPIKSADLEIGAVIHLPEGLVKTG